MDQNYRKMKKIAIIGASTGQLPLCKKAAEMGLETYCFAWSNNAICKDFVDHFIPVSIFDMDEIVKLCKEYGINGVVSNASESTAYVVSYVAEKLGLVCTPNSTIKRIQDKSWVREVTNKIDGFSPVNYYTGNAQTLLNEIKRPFVLKPINGASKKGVSYIDNNNEDYKIDNDLKDATFIAEEYIEGKEYSVETMSYNSMHQVLQITEKISKGIPHFVELEHHQPAIIKETIKEKILELIPKLLLAVGYINGACHIEIKIDDKDNIYLIELNPRGAGDCISNELINLSTSYDFLKNLILVSLGEYTYEEVLQKAYSGIYFLTEYTKRLLPYFDNGNIDWIVKKEKYQNELTESTSNYDRDGYLIYCSTKKIII